MATRQFVLCSLSLSLSLTLTLSVSLGFFYVLSPVGVTSTTLHSHYLYLQHSPALSRVRLSLFLTLCLLTIITVSGFPCRIDQVKVKNSGMPEGTFLKRSVAKHEETRKPIKEADLLIGKTVKLAGRDCKIVGSDEFTRSSGSPIPSTAPI